jgi:hypothetical protein
MTDTPGAWPATPDDADVIKQQDAARAVRMRLSGSRGSGAPKATLASAANAVRALMGGAR